MTCHQIGDDKKTEASLAARPDMLFDPDLQVQSGYQEAGRRTRREQEEGDQSRFQNDRHGNTMDPSKVLTEVCPYFDRTIVAL